MSLDKARFLGMVAVTQAVVILTRHRDAYDQIVLAICAGLLWVALSYLIRRGQ